jgi:hypothetical protein
MNVEAAGLETEAEVTEAATEAEAAKTEAEVAMAVIEEEGRINSVNSGCIVRAEGNR